VRVEVEVRVLDPHRVMQAQRYLDESAPERRQQVQPTLQLVPQLVDVEAAIDA
jgi:hypothetical protein